MLKTPSIGDMSETIVIEKRARIIKWKKITLELTATAN